MQETARLRDRVSKKDKDRFSKRRRGDRLMHGSNREGGEESTDESIEDDEEEEDDDTGSIRMLPPNQASSSSNHHSNQHHHRKGFLTGKVIRSAPSFKVADEMIGISVPRKARSGEKKKLQNFEKKMVLFGGFKQKKYLIMFCFCSFCQKVTGLLDFRCNRADSPASFNLSG